MALINKHKLEHIIDDGDIARLDVLTDERISEIADALENDNDGSVDVGFCRIASDILYHYIKLRRERRAAFTYRDFEQFNGKNLNEIGEHIEKPSTYNWNWYRLPNGAIVLEECDEFYETCNYYLMKNDGESYKPDYSRFIGYAGGLGEDFHATDQIPT